MSRFDQIAGYEAEKKELYNISKIFRSYKEFSARGIRLPHGVLLSGEPGVGKTMLAEALVEGAAVHCERIDVSDFSLDDADEYFAEKFRAALNNAPSIVFFDEMDKFVGDASNGFRQGYNIEATRKLLKAINDNSSDLVMLVATVNSEEMLSDELRRSGRFDRTLRVALPDLDDRKSIIEYYARNKTFDDKVDFDWLAKITRGLSGADIECFMNDAGLNAVIDGREKISQSDLNDAVNRLMFKTSKSEMPTSEKDTEVIATHEAGHLVAALVIDKKSVGSITILAQGKSGGHVKLCDDGKKTRSKKETLDNVTIGLAGKASEKFFYPDEEYLGAASDIATTERSVEEMVTSGAAYGFEYYLEINDAPFQETIVSNEKVLKIEKLCDTLMCECYERATSIIEENSELVQKFVKELLKKYTLSREEILKIYTRETKKRRNT